MSFSSLCISLSLVFGFLLLAMFAQIFYVLWWKKRRTTKHLDIEMNQGNYAKGLFYFGCWKKTSCSMHATNQRQNIETKNHEQDIEISSGVDGKDLVLKSSDEESLESELMRLHNLHGPPRFLFTIKEETKEDLESEDGKSKCSRSRKGSRTKSLSDFIESPLKFPLDPFESCKHQGFNPLFESSKESDFNRFRSSPPPKFKFLRDAEEKLYRKLMEEETKRKTLEEVNHGSVSEFEVTNLTNVTEKQLQECLPQFPSSSSQVLPLTSSPTTFKPLENSSMVH